MGAEKTIEEVMTCFRDSVTSTLFIIRLLIVEKEVKVSKPVTGAWTYSNQLAFLAIVAPHVDSMKDILGGCAIMEVA